METQNQIAVREPQSPALLSLGPEQIALIKKQVCVGSSDDELQLFLYQARRTGLDPLARQIYAVFRNAKEGNDYVKKMTVQVSIDGFRLIAERSGKYAGQLGPWWTGDGSTWTDCWLDETPPKAAKVGVMRSDFKEPLFAVARWDSYKQEGKYGLSPMWKKMPDLMLAKVAESLALRKAFPQELSGLYTGDEMAQADGQSNEGQLPAPEKSKPVHDKPAQLAQLRANAQRDNISEAVLVIYLQWLEKSNGDRVLNEKETLDDLTGIELHSVLNGWQNIASEIHDDKLNVSAGN